MIAIISSAKNLLGNMKIRSVEFIVQQLTNVAKCYNGNEMIVSIGTGSGTTELLSQRLCLCINIDKRSFFAGLNQVNGRISINRTTILALLDYSEDIEQLLQAIKIAIPKKTIRVLIQRLSPSIDDKNRCNIKCLFSLIRTSIEIGIIHYITFVYDFSHKRNTWCKTKLLSLFMHNIEQTFTDNYVVTESKIISLKGSDVGHPLFGKNNRYG